MKSKRAAWSDDDQLMQAIASAVWELCRNDEHTNVYDDPRNIAAVAATVARQHLCAPTAMGSSTTMSEAP